ncbi:ribosomal protein S10p/S20e-domain-containing protein [Chytriomyces sp. MP71]|nr:ribosomal protein S10p/S20e-domain-containing protein [Chytriomyces sp. MP71]
MFASRLRLARNQPIFSGTRRAFSSEEGSVPVPTSDATLPPQTPAQAKPLHSQPVNNAPKATYSLETFNIPLSAIQIPAILNPSLPSKPSTHYLVSNVELSGYMPDHLDFLAYFAAHAAHKRGIATSSHAIHLQTETERWHVTKGPFVHDKSKEVFERKTYRRLVQAFNADEANVRDWYEHVNRNLPPGVDMKVETFSHSAPASLKDLITSLEVQVQAEAADAQTRLENTLGPDAAKDAVAANKKPVSFEEDVRARAAEFVKKAMAGAKQGVKVDGKGKLVAKGEDAKAGKPDGATTD